jgi:hypothetical protein
MNIGQMLKAGLDSASTQFTAYLVALVVISSLTMALLQAAKEMTPLRRVYNRRRLQAWLGARALKVHHGTHNAAEAETELLRLATDGDANAFFNAELEALCSQFSSAAMVVMDAPSLNQESEALFRLLTVNAPGEDVKLLLRAKLPNPLSAYALEKQTVAEITDAADRRQTLIDARNRVRHQITQSISSFQISTGAHWQLGLKWASWILSTLLVIAMLALATGNVKSAFERPGMLLFTAGFSGFLAPIARDLLAALQKLRT